MSGRDRAQNGRQGDVVRRLKPCANAKRVTMSRCLRACASIRDGRIAVILNLSTKGLKFRCTAMLQRGHFLELRRGSHVIVAQVMWSDGGMCGARAQGLIPIADVVLDKPSKRSMFTPVERRAAPRTSVEQAETARRSGRAMEMLLAGFGAVCAAFFIADLAFGILKSPLEKVETVMSAR